jgi:NADP-dependent 3-hydroxy acid dehydrogenase YdfG
MIPRTLLITGASSGIGRALALEYARRGAHVAVAARRTTELEALVSDIAANGGKALPLTVDVADAAAAAETVRQAERDLGSLDMVIANAGVAVHKHVSTLEPEQLLHLLKVNVLGAIATLHAAVPIMLSQQRGHLVGVSSLAGRRGLPYSAPYCASKAALSTFLESLRIELHAAGLRVTDVQPGFVETAMTRAGVGPRPFKWTAPKAARVIVRRLERAPAVVAFPWPLDTLSALCRLLPASIYDRAVRLFPMGQG